MDAVRTSFHHDLPGAAAKMAYFSFLSLFPALLVVSALTGIIGGDAAFARIASTFREATPADAWRFLAGFLEDVAIQRRPAILSIGAVLLVWSASSGIAALTYALNAILGIEERRGWWSRRVLALIVFAVGALLLVTGATVLFTGIDVMRSLGFGEGWRIARWPLALALLAATIWLAYYFLPNREHRRAGREALKGAMLATALWTLATLLLGFWIGYIRDYSRIYGGVGAVIALLVWFYLTSLAVLFGAEFAAALERRDGAEVGHERP